LIVHGGDAPLPASVREVIVRGSTSVEERTGDEPARALAARCASADWSEGADAIVFVTPDGAGHVRGLGDEQIFEWPRDQDRLVMASMTGA